MNIEDLREYCLSFNGTQENMPWTEPQYCMLATFTVGGKWFCILDMDKKFINVKCAPEKVQEMQARYQGAFPAWHMNKEHWLGITAQAESPVHEITGKVLNLGYENFGSILDVSPYGS